MPPVNSMTRCEALVADGHYKTFGETVEKLVDIIGLYNECRARHNALVDYEEKRK